LYTNFGLSVLKMKEFGDEEGLWVSGEDGQQLMANKKMMTMKREMSLSMNLC